MAVQIELAGQPSCHANGLVELQDDLVLLAAGVPGPAEVGRRDRVGRGLAVMVALDERWSKSGEFRLAGQRIMAAARAA